MGCVQTDFYTPASAALISVAIAAWTALMPQYAFISFMTAVLYCRIAVLAFKPLCGWSRRFSEAYAAGGAASILAYAYAMSEAARLVGAGGAVFVLLTALAALTAYLLALERLLPSGGYPPLPVSASPLGRSIEMLGEAEDVCAANMPHSGLQRLICRGDLSAADNLPGHVLIVAAYYAAFRRRDLSLAGSLLRILKSRNLFPDEKEAVEILEAAHKAAAACSAQAVCKLATRYTWTALFKELVALHFAYSAKEAAKLKCRAVNAFKRYEVFARGTWHTEYEPDPLLYFIFHAADRAEPYCQPQA
ncbi:MAG: hypothetical protein ACO2PM_11215 [Pyrobaculum sp.]|jgi:hypothetical protein